MDVDQAPAASDNSAEPQRMQRKLVSKTYVNDEGYMGPLICIEYRLFVFVQFVVVISLFAKLIRVRTFRKNSYFIRSLLHVTENIV